jgi:hypothetical protein
MRYIAHIPQCIDARESSDIPQIPPARRFFVESFTGVLKIDPKKEEARSEPEEGREEEGRKRNRPNQARG